MASTNQEPLGVRRRKALYESRREREFYRYYEPIRALTSSGPALCDLHDAEAAKAHLARSSPDRALTAFCQLGALRIGARRAMMFFFDSNYAYILAEATRTLSLLDDSVHEIEDALWMGHSIIPRGFSVCEHTANLPANEGSNRNEPNAGIVHIVNDLTGDVRFCDRPYVKGGPLARFYAGVPITTPKGINIGAYCILDDKPRDGLSDKDVAFLNDMAATITTHLEMVRATADHKRDSSMLSGLSAFVDGASSLRHRKKMPGTGDRRRASSLYTPSEAALNPGTPFSRSGPAPEDIKRPAAEQHVSVEHNTARSPVNDAKVSAPSFPSEPETPSDQSLEFANSATVNITAGNDLQEQHVAPNVKATFQRVARIVREAVDVDGALLLEASVASYYGLVGRKDHQPNSEPTSDSSGLSTSDVPNTENDEATDTEKQGNDIKEAPCYVLSSSLSSAVTDNENNASNYAVLNSMSRIGDNFLQVLLRKYPRGKIWNFNEEGDASSEDESSGSSTSQRGDSHGQPAATDDSGREKSRRNRKRKRARIDDSREVQRLFPGARSVALVGMWDQIKGRWYAGCVVWTYSPLRLFSERCELNFMAAFCDTVMAEVHRLEAQNSDNAKMDFISSISHELRSPLHGILGSVECLQEQRWDASSDGLISQVEVCARTLLDIVNHVLDFSKINRYARAKYRSMGSRQSRRRLSGIADETSRVGGEMTLDANVLLDVSTEEVIETTFYSFCCSKDQQTIVDRKVAFILDIDRSSEANWRCRIAIGGWKRICINLISNALKYTTQGYVHVSLKSVPIHHRQKSNAVLTVSDTGRGMSQDFLVNQLFKAFSQEDTLVEGTGLGTSLVAKIVKSLGGKIDVKSMKDVGTTITVTVPLGHSIEDQVDRTSHTQRLNGVSIGILESTGDSFRKKASDSPWDGDGNILLVSSMKRTLSELGTHVQSVNTFEATTADLAIVLEPDLARLQASLDDLDEKPSALLTAKLTDIPWIIVCNNAISERRVRSELAALPTRVNDVVISLPAGPNRLTEAIWACLKSEPESKAVRMNRANVEVINGKELIEPTTIRVEPTSLAGPSSKTHRRWRSDGVTSPPNEALELRLLHAELLQQPNNLPGDLPSERFPEHNVGVRQTMDAPRTQKLGGALQLNATEDVRKELCLLLVDDNQINLQLLVTYAEKRKYQKITARDGFQAVEAYKTACMRLDLARSDGSNSKDRPPGKPQVVLMDINMPVLDGFEATRRIRKFEKQERLEAATIIALTGLGSSDAQQEAYASGVDLFLTKPVRLKVLTRILENVNCA